MPHNNTKFDDCISLCGLTVWSHGKFNLEARTSQQHPAIKRSKEEITLCSGKDKPGEGHRRGTVSRIFQPSKPHCSLLSTMSICLPTLWYVSFIKSNSLRSAARRSDLTCHPNLMGHSRSRAVSVRRPVTILSITLHTYVDKCLPLVPCLLVENYSNCVHAMT